MRAEWMPSTLPNIVRLHASTREENMGYESKGRVIGARKAALFIGALFLTAPHMPAVGGAAASEAEPRYIGFTKLNVTNLDASVKFYTTVMGLKVSAVVDMPTINETILTRTGGGDEEALVLVYNKKPAQPFVLGNAFNNVTFRTNDFEGVIKRLEAAGYPITAKRQQVPSSVPYGAKMSYAFTKDPDGFSIEILQFHK